MKNISSFGGCAIRRKYDRKGVGFIGCMLLVFFMCAPVTAMAMEYGETGPYKVSRETIKNPLSTWNCTCPI